MTTSRARTKTTATRAAFVVGAVVATAAAAGLAAAPAQAAPPGAVTIASAPISVVQWPAVGLQFSGLVVPMPALGNVTAATTGTRGITRLAAPFPATTCSASGGGALVSINWLNVTNGRSGNATVKPCTNFLDPTPHHRDVATGSGQIVLSTHLIGSRAYPNAAQPSLPGAGGFIAP
ncbi:hypothetical protein [Gordonia alkaliphila]|uniref:Secreted protein n=1 Tax=Gordonia alkaliphila TaxID=1053547 RepID=A0ABP8Z9K8_9ACTN